jgi:hypothetical protein
MQPYSAHANYRFDFRYKEKQDNVRNVGTNGSRVRRRIQPSARDASHQSGVSIFGEFHALKRAFARTPIDLAPGKKPWNGSHRFADKEERQML